MEAHPDTTTHAGQILASVSGGKRRPGDRIFSNAAVIASVTVLALLAGVAIFLIADSVPAITANTADLPDGKNLVDYIAPLAFGTILAAAVAVVIAVPLAVAVALFISHIAPRRIANPLAYIVDLLAAIPSIVYGLWGIFVLGPAMVPILDWLVAQARAADCDSFLLDSGVQRFGAHRFYLQKRLEIRAHHFVLPLR